jgi:outer membrane usher protein
MSRASESASPARARRRLAGGARAFAVGAGFAAAAAAAAPAGPAPEALLLAVRVNGVDADDSVRVLQVNGRVALSRADWAALHLRAPAGGPVKLRGQDYLPLDGLASVRWHIDAPSQTLVIDAPAAAFAGVALRLDVNATAPTVPAATGAYGNYDVELQRGLAGRDGARQVVSAQLDAGASAFGGSLTTSGLLLDDGLARRVTRLDTTWTQDRPSRLASLRAGDAVTLAGTWGRALRFGGLQWATDFSLQPGFLPFPVPSMHGEAALPSSVDVYVNNARRLQSDVPAGPFDLNELPIVTGSGEVRLVVRDALGREQVITQPYFVSPALLKPGLRAFSFEAGAVREDYALRSDRYGHAIASATDRAGVTEAFTRELRAEFQPGLAAAGATGIWLVPGLGVATLGAVASHSAADGEGGAAIASLNHQDRVWNGSVQYQRNTRGFSQLGVPAQDALRTQATAAVGGSVSGMPVGAGFVYQTPWNGAPQRLLSFNAACGLGRFGTLGLYGLRELGTGATTVSLSYSVSLDARTSAAVGATRSGGRGLATTRNGSVEVQRNLPEGEGLGWSLSAQDDDRGQAQLFARTAWADLNAGVARANGQTDVRMGAAGGAAWIDDTTFVSRRIDGTYAVVEVGDYPDVAILRDNHPVARTDEHGRALVPGLRGNEVNRVGVDAADLPLDASVDALDLDFIPPAHAGVVLRLPVTRSRSASLRVLGPDGMPLPPGTTLRMAGRDTVFPVGFDGRTFVTGLHAGTRLRARGAGADCGFALSVPEGDADDLPDLGNVVCR